jgi:hypothetical protein
VSFFANVRIFRTVHGSQKGKPFSAEGYPPSPLFFGFSKLRAKPRKIFDVKELIGKIFRIKHLAAPEPDGRKFARATYGDEKN